jgi:hypothetical protein
MLKVLRTGTIADMLKSYPADKGDKYMDKTGHYNRYITTTR